MPLGGGKTRAQIRAQTCPCTSTRSALGFHVRRISGRHGRPCCCVGPRVVGGRGRRGSGTVRGSRRHRGRPLPFDEFRPTAVGADSPALATVVVSRVHPDVSPHRAETSLFEILSVLRRADTIDPGELDEITVTADSALRAMFAVSSDVVAMERAVAATPKVTEPLDPTIDGAVRELQSGLDQYEDLVTSAAALTAPHSPSALVGFNRELSALHAAAERLSALADAIGEVDDITRKYN